MRRHSLSLLRSSWIALGLVLLGGSPTASAAVASSALQAIRSLNGALTTQGGDAPATLAILRERAGRLADLMELDPSAAVELALPDSVRKDLLARVPSAAAFVEERGVWSGSLAILVEDNSRSHSSRSVASLRVGDRDYTLHSNALGAAKCASSATARGIRLGTRIAASEVEIAPEAAAACASTGPQKTAVLMVNYKSTQITPGYTPAFIQSNFFGPAPSMADYVNEASYGSASVSGTVFGPFNLNADFACNQQNDVLKAAIAAADPVVDLTSYNRIFLILPVVVAGGCAYDGYALIGCVPLSSPAHGPITASVAWLETPSLGPNIFGLLGEFASTVIHEMGHNLGLQHSNSLDYDTVPIGPPDTDGVHKEYGDPFSFMGSNPGHYASPHKNMLGWIGEGAGYTSVQSAGSWTLSPMSQPGAAGPGNSPRALRVRRGTGSDQWLWVEYRQPIGAYEPTVLDNDAPRSFAGVQIYLEDPFQTTNSPGHANLLDFEPAKLPNDFNSAPLTAGTTWSDAYSNLTLTVGAASPSSVAVTVSYDNGCSTLSAASQSFGPNGGTGQVSVQAPSSCAWRAQRGAEWIALTGPTSGTGPGTISFTVAENDSTSARSSLISVSHQTLAVTQSVLPQAGSVAATPSKGTGPAQTFAFAFSDASSASNLTWGEININASNVTSRSCYVHWQANGRLVSLRDDADGSWLGPVVIGSGTPLSNSQCVVHPESAVLTSVGAMATLNLNVEFTNLFANGQMNLYMQERGISSALGWTQVGSWIVSFPFRPLSMSPVAGTGIQTSFTINVAGYYQPDQIIVAFSTSTAFGTLQFYDHGCAVALGPGASNAYLYPDLTGGVGTSAVLGTGAPFGNSQCTVDPLESSVVLNGSTLTVTLAVTFAPGFSGVKNAYVFGPGSGYALGASLTPIGTFNVFSLSATPSSVQFTAPYGSTTPTGQSVAITSPGPSLSIRVSADESWLSVSADNSSPPATLTVRTNPSGLPAATYTGSVIVTATAGGGIIYRLPVSLTVTGAVAQEGLMNAASLAVSSAGMLAPNTILSLFGPVPACSGELAVTVNGSPTQILAATAGQINFSVPQSVAIGPATLQVACGNTVAETVSGTVVQVAPAIFTLTGTGTGQAAVVNGDGTVNSASSAAARGGYLSVYATGLGPLQAPAGDGLSRTLFGVTASIGGTPATVLYAGSAPGQTLGLQQINLVVPMSAPTGGAVPLVLTVGGVVTQAGVTIGVR